MALPKNYSIWLAVDYDGIEKAFWNKPKRCEKHGEWWGDKMVLPHGSVKKLIGRELSWSDEPVELKEEQLMFGFYVILTLAVLYIAFMGGVIGYLIGKYWKR